MGSIRSILKQKEHQEVWDISADNTVYDALKILADKNIGFLLVRESGHPVGVFTERDYARKVILEGKSSKDTKVSKVMRSPVLYVEPTHTLDECRALMIDKGIRHLPVCESEKVIGVISMTDIIRSVIQEREFEIEQLESYIRGGR